MHTYPIANVSKVKAILTLTQKIITKPRHIESNLHRLCIFQTFAWEMLKSKQVMCEKDFRILTESESCRIYLPTGNSFIAFLLQYITP